MSSRSLTLTVLSLLFLVISEIAIARQLPALYSVSNDSIGNHSPISVLNETQDGAEVGTIARNGQIIEVLRITEDSNWAYVAADEEGVLGWIPLEELRYESSPWDENKTAFETTLYCDGAEPFWSMAISGKAQIEFNNWNSTFHLERSYAGFPRNRGGFSIQVMQAEGDGLSLTAFLRTKECGQISGHASFEATLIGKISEEHWVVMGCCSLSERHR